VTTVWVYAEVSPERGADGTALELLTKARDLGDEVAAVALGPGATEAAPVLGAHGAGQVYASDDEVFVRFVAEPAAHVLHRLVEEHAPDLVLFATHYDSRDVAGRLSGKTGAPLMSNATDVLAVDRARTPVAGGGAYVDVALEGPLRIVLVRPKSFAAQPSGGRPEIVDVESDVPDGCKRARRVESHEQATAGPKLEDAGVVLAGGRGLGAAANFELLDRLATLIDDAAVGATRAVVDAGWVPYAYQIGQTGKTVKPGVYVAAGISGATQHVVGMKGAKKVIAINKDEDAPIFQMADLGVVGDALQVLERLVEEIKDRKG
jgi:electron transfer flavoprotein alpha subunit